MDEIKTKRAIEVYNTLKAALDAQHWHYDANDEALTISLGVNGEDIPMNFILVVDGERELVRMLSLLPFKAERERLLALAIATCQANYKLVDGCFVYNIEDGAILYRITSSFRGSIISIDLLRYMINMACHVVDEYNDRFLAISKGMLSLEDFLKQ